MENPIKMDDLGCPAPLFLETSTKAVGQAADKRREEFERLQEFQPRIGGHGLRQFFVEGVSSEKVKRHMKDWVVVSNISSGSGNLPAHE